MLGVIWWMYGGYAWMTNAVNANTVPRRLVLLAAMGAYFVLALSIPDAFAGTGLAFGAAYLLVVVLHSALFTAGLGGERSPGDPHARALQRVRRARGADRRRARRHGAVRPLGRCRPVRVVDAVVPRH